MDLVGYESKYPRELSGGESQRVSLARSLLLEPEVLLMDEPFSALDVNTRLEMQKLINKLHTSRNMTIVFVTHDLEEAFSLSDRVAIVSKGKIFQVDTPYEIYTNPNSEFVANFVGVTNVYRKCDLKVLLDNETFTRITKKYMDKENEHSKIGFRAKSISLDENGSIKGCRLVYSKFKGDTCSFHFEKEKIKIVVDSTSNYHKKFDVGYIANLEFDDNEIVNIKD
jgi:putative spermidine/putrescine transport system ATP-binding protein